MTMWNCGRHPFDSKSTKLTQKWNLSSILFSNNKAEWTNFHFFTPPKKIQFLNRKTTIVRLKEIATRQHKSERRRSTYRPTQSLRISSVLSHFLTNFPGSTSSVLHCDFTTFLVEHRSPDDPPLSPASESDSPGSSLQTHPILCSRNREPSLSARFLILRSRLLLEHHG